MNKEEFISYIKDGNISIVAATTILMNYCIEHGKDARMTNVFIDILLNTGMIQDYLLEAIEYYKKKLNVCEVKRNEQTLLIF